jgi:hypothetical protein
MALVARRSNRRSLLQVKVLDGLDTLADSSDELPSVTDLLSRARPVASRVAPQVIDLTVDSSDDVSYLHKSLSFMGRLTVFAYTAYAHPLSLFKHL